jgi:uncharacterized protein
MTLQITLTMAGAAALLNLWLGGRVSRLRSQFKVSVGDGGNDAVLRRMRAQANYIEHAPFFLILLALLELAGANGWLLWGAGIAFILARIAHGYGMDAAAPRLLRAIGMMTTAIVIVLLAGYAIFIAYQAPPLSTGVTLPAGRSASAGAS